MLISVILFWISLGILFFCYFGYGLLVFLWNRIRRIFTTPGIKEEPTEWMPVTLVIAAYNEAAILEQKINNSLAIDYPPGKLTILFVTDGSTDGSEAIIPNHPSVTILHQPERRGKMAAIQRAMKQVNTPVVVFSDANAMLNKESIRKIVAHYADPKTGGVAGEKKIITDKHRTAVGEAEGIYWNYESFMKKQDADLNTVVGAAGELFSIRTELFPSLNEKVILDDFVISMKVCLLGYRVEYEPEAFATESPSASLKEEEKRKVRISAGAYQSIGYLKSALNIFKHPVLSFQYMSRRLLRWIFCPLMLVILLLTNALVVLAPGIHGFYILVLLEQLTFYIAAFIGWLIIRSGRNPGLLTIPFYFVFMNYCLVKGFFKFLGGKQSVLWEKSVRRE